MKVTQNKSDILNKINVNNVFFFELSFLLKITLAFAAALCCNSKKEADM